MPLLLKGRHDPRRLPKVRPLDARGVRYRLSPLEAVKKNLRAGEEANSGILKHIPGTDLISVQITETFAGRLTGELTDDRVTVTDSRSGGGRRRTAASCHHQVPEPRVWQYLQVNIAKRGTRSVRRG